MARLARAEVFAADEIAFDRRTGGIEDRLRQLAAAFGIDLLAFRCLAIIFI